MKIMNIVPDMKETFGKLTFAGEGEVVKQGSRRNEKIISRTYNLFSDKQRADNVEVIVTGNVAQKAFEFEDVVELENPRIEVVGKNIQGQGYADYILYADDIKKVQ